MSFLCAEVTFDSIDVRRTVCVEINEGTAGNTSAPRWADLEPRTPNTRVHSDYLILDFGGLRSGPMIRCAWFELESAAASCSTTHQKHYRTLSKLGYAAGLQEYQKETEHRSL